MAKTKSNKMIWMLIAIPAASVVMGFVTLTLALKTADNPVVIEEPPLSKTSWSDTP